MNWKIKRIEKEWGEGQTLTTYYFRGEVKGGDENLTIIKKEKIGEKPTLEVRKHRNFNVESQNVYNCIINLLIDIRVLIAENKDDIERVPLHNHYNLLTTLACLVNGII